MVLELAQLYLLQGQLDLCEQRCVPLLEMEQTHERAAVVGDAMRHTSPGALGPDWACFLIADPQMPHWLWDPDPSLLLYVGRDGLASRGRQQPLRRAVAAGRG